MATQLHVSQPTALPSETWEIRTTNGQVLRRLTVSTIARGLQEGWLSLDDEACQTLQDSWGPIRTTLAKTVPSIRVFVDPVGVYAGQYGSAVANVLAVLSIFSGFLYSGITLFHLEVGHAFVYAVALLIGLIGVNRNNLLLMLFGIGIAIQMAGLPIKFEFIIGFLIGLLINMLLSGAIGGVVGYVLGYMIGLIVGLLRRSRYQLPTIRRPVPDEIKELSQKPVPDRQSSNLFDRQEVVDFYKATLVAWSSGQLDILNPSYRREANNVDRFVKANLPVEGGALHTFLSSFALRPGEFLVEKNDDSFVLTNLRLVQKDGKDNIFQEIPLAEVKNFKSNAESSTLTFEMETGQVIELSKIGYYPNDRYLSEMIKRAKQGQMTPAAAMPAGDSIATDAIQSRIAAGLCPKCGKPVTPTAQNCPSCRINLVWARQNSDQLAVETGRA